MKKLVSLLAILLLLSGVVSAIPNPAAVYCGEQGYEYEIRTLPDGSQYGVCIFPDGSECSAWQFYCNCEPNSVWCWPGNYSCHWPCEELRCREAGEFISISECCGGLSEIPRIEAYDDECNFVGWIGWMYICSDCGNGICESWESKCNCPQDCNCLDTDNDSVCDWADNCPDVYNPDQNDTDGDGVGNICDKCWYAPNPNQEDSFGLNCSDIAVPYLEDPHCGNACDCYQEGERFMDFEGNLECCPGLVKAFDCFPDEPIGAPDSCVCPTCPCYVCIRCGNGICGTEENWCNCLADCPKPEEVPCTGDIDCGRDFCGQGRNVCHEIKYSCINGECSHTHKQYVNCSCAAYYYPDLDYPDNAKCIDTCGDGICHGPETRWWCPEDCECSDRDNDSVCDWADNCPDDYNPDQTDSDGDGIGNVCDEDCPNLDGLNPVGLVDFSILAYNWQLTEPNLLGDLNFDEVVDINDLAVFSLYWLSECYEQ